MILPARRSFYILTGFLAAALVVSFYPDLQPLWLLALGLWVVSAAYDAWRAWRTPRIKLSRDVPHSLPVGIQRNVSLHITQDSQRPLTIELFDHAPAELAVQGLPLRFSLAPNTFAQPQYSIQPVERGRYEYQIAQARVLSPLQLWWHDYKLAVPSELRIYPNFAAIAQYTLLATDNKLSQIGIRKQRRRGEGQDFHQLREYRAGDSLRQIDWKATARMYKAISREYQDERDQEIILLMDCGHRMQARDGALSHFDHTLNAALLLAYVALRQGDAVGLGTFGGTQRWLPARKGHYALNQLLNALYDLQPTAQAPDYSQAATELLVRQKKRALVILVTNLRDEDTEDLMPALHLLRRRHLLLLSSMREQALDKALQTPVEKLEQAIEQAAIINYLQQRQTTLEKIRRSGIHALDVAPNHLSSALINRYLDIKRSGAL